MPTNTSADISERPRLGGIESLRAYAALAIVVFHVIHLTGTPIPQSLEFMKWYFGFGVPLFFVVSAFSLAYGYAGRLNTASASWKFYVRRFFRIAPLFYAATIFTLVTTQNLSWTSTNWPTLTANVFFAFNLFPDMVNGIAPASWSIGVEVLFYAVLPLVLLVVRGPLSAAVATAGAFLIAVAFGVKIDALEDVPASFIQHGLLFNLPYFGFGLLAFFTYRHLTSRRAMFALVAAALGLLILWAMAAWPTPLMPGRILNTVYQGLWGAPFALLCLGMARAPPYFLSNPATQFLGKISFSLYLAHPHVIALLTGWGIYSRINALPGGSGVGFPIAVLTTVTVLVPLSWILYKIIEEPGMNLGRSIIQRSIRTPRVEPIA